MKCHNSFFVRGILAISMGIIFAACGNTQSKQVTSETHTNETKTANNAGTPEQSNSGGNPSQPVVTVTDNTPSKEILPAELSITAKFDGEPKSSAFDQDTAIATMLDAGIAAPAIVPEFSKTLYLMRAKTVKFVSPDAGSCVLSQKNFRDLRSGSASGFTFLGIDTKGSSMDCTRLLYAARVQGFMVEFSDVPVSQWADAGVIAKVTLTVTP